MSTSNPFWAAEKPLPQKGERILIFRVSQQCRQTVLAGADAWCEATVLGPKGMKHEIRFEVSTANTTSFPDS